MNKKRFFLIIGLVLVLLVIVIIVLKLTGASKDQTPEISGPNEIDRLASIVGEQPSSHTENSEEEPGVVQRIVYEDGVVSIDQINEYIRKLMQEDGFIVTKEAEIGEDGRQTYQLGKMSDQENKVILVDFQFETGGSVHVVYRLADGPLESVG